MMRCAGWLSVGALVLASCSSPEEVEEKTGNDAPAAATTTAAGDSSAASSPAEAVKFSAEEDQYSFDYAYPEEAAAIPALKKRFDTALETNKSKLENMARDAEESAREDGFPFNAYAEGTEWKVVTDTPRFLSLSASIYSYTGGAHPNSGTTSLIWDREADRALKAMDFFVSPSAFAEAVAEPYCKALNAQRKERRGGEDGAGIEAFSECPKASELTVLLGSTNRQAFNRIGLIADPYVAGSYAEGGYEVTLPVTKAVMSAVKPEYKEAFAIR